MESENYLARGYGIRLAMEKRRAGWVRVAALARVWQPSRLKGTTVSPEYGTPFLAATQIFDLRPVPRKFLSLDQIRVAGDLFVSSGQILVTRSGSVGRATLAQKTHEGVIISDDLLRVEAKKKEYWGWLYAYLRAFQARAMMSAAQYGHIIKHLEVAHLDVLPMPLVRDDLLDHFSQGVQGILDARNHGHSLLLRAERRFEEEIGLFDTSDGGELGYTVLASVLFRERRRFEGYFHNPAVQSIQQYFAKKGLITTSVLGAGFDVWLPARFRRIPAPEGVKFLDSSDLFEVNPDITKRIADGDFGDRNRGRVQTGWLLLARSGQIYGLNGSLNLASAAHEGPVVSDHVIRIAPNKHQSVRTGYVFTALSHPRLGRPLVKALAYGSSIPEIDVADVGQLGIVRLPSPIEEEIADLAEAGSASLAKADLLENDIASEAEAIIDRFLTGDTSDVVVCQCGAPTR